MRLVDRIKATCITPNSLVFSPQANYTDWATTIGQGIFSVNFCGVAWSVWRIPTAVNLGFLHRPIYIQDTDTK
jgi:hypothetical protein